MLFFYTLLTIFTNYGNINIVNNVNKGKKYEEVFFIKRKKHDNRILKVLLLAGLLFFLVSSFGSASILAANDKSTDYNNGIIDKINIKGNLHAPDIIIKEQIKNLKVGEPFDRDLAKKDVENIYNTGYFYKVQVGTEKQNQTDIVTFDVRQNPIISEFNIYGNDLISDKEIKSVIENGENHILNKKLLQKDFQNIIEKYKEEGYAGVKIEDTEYKKNESLSKKLALRGKLDITIRENLINKVKIEGLKETKLSLVKPEITFAEGEHLTVKDYKETYKNLQNLNFFKKVQIKTEVAKEEGVNVVVKLTEKKTGSYSVGVGYNEEKGALFMADISESNLFGTGKKASFESEKNEDGYELEVGYTDPYFTEDLILSSNIAVEDKSEEEFEVKSKKINTPITKKVNDNFNLYGKLELEKYKNSNPNILDGNINTISFGANYNNLENKFHPQNGLVLNSKIEISNKALNSDYDYTKTSFQLSRYFKGLLQNHSIATDIELGYASSDIPDYKQFIASKRGRLKSYDYGKIKGTKMVVANAEYRIPIWEDKVLGIAAINIGDAWSSENYNTEDIVIEAGLGTKIKLGSFGNIRIDYTINKDKEHRTNITIGSSF
jgi:outer membrane protein insertion porin family